jgi:EAL domain-containing protein (putative c-di-GMP-specific phosphodiesterase class I)
VIVFTDASTRWAADQRRARELENLNWVGRIRDALDEERLVLYAQPIMDVRSREVVMYELLLRMVDSDGTIIAPGRFLPAAEQYGLIEDIDRWVLAEAIKLAARGQKVHFNISGKSLGSRVLINDLTRLLNETGADPGLLICEITETALASDEALNEAFVHDLSALGCQIALDDFGVGYGGFAYLKRLPITVIKIDIQFVRDLDTNYQNQHIVKATVNLAQGFGRQTVAEGVEAQALLELLEQYGVDYAQGFAIGLPAPVERRLEG